MRSILWRLYASVIAAVLTPDPAHKAKPTDRHKLWQVHNKGPFSALFCAFHWAYAAARLSASDLSSLSRQGIQGGSNRQDLVFVRQPDAGKDFRVNINTVWHCRVLLLFSFYTSTDSGIKRPDCVFVSESVLCAYDKDPPGAKLC